MKAFGKFLNLIILLLMVAYTGFFAYLNTDATYINLPYIGDFRLPLSISMIGSFVVGSFLTGIYLAIDVSRKTIQIKKQKKEIEILKRQNAHEHTFNNTDKNTQNLAVSKTG